MVSPHYLENCLPQRFYILHTYWSWCGLDLDFVFFSAKVKDTKVTFVKKWFPLIFLRTIYYGAFICNVLIVLSVEKTPFDFGFTKSKGKVTRVTFVKLCKHGFCSLSWELFITKLLYFTCWLILVRTRFF